MGEREHVRRQGQAPGHAEPAAAGASAQPQSAPQPGPQTRQPHGDKSMAPRSPSPAQVLGLQARLGNRAVQRMLGSAQPRPTPAPGSSAPRPAPLRRPAPVQRKAYLENADQNIYKDSDVDLELSYIGKDKDNRPFFMEYALFKKLQGEVETAWAQAEKDGIAQFYPSYDNFVLQYLNGNYRADAFVVYQENKEGKLVVVKLNPLALYNDLQHAVSGGPLYWNTGGGSRLPPAKGTIYTNGLTSDEVEKALGVTAKDAAKFKDVKVVKYDDQMDFFRKFEEAFHSKANFIDYKHFFYVSDVTVKRSKSSQFQANGKYYDETFSSVGANSQEELLLKQSYGKLTAPQGQDWDTTLSSRDRGDGQAKAMGNWNALGAAAFANKYLGKNLPLNQNWEWLHIRGAQIGGYTTGGNLVPGLFVTNSQMIPYESQIAKWAQKGGKKIAARFGVGKVEGVFTDQIVIEVSAQDHPELGTIPQDNPARVTFDPLNGRVVDKMMGRIEKAKFDKQLGHKRELPEVKIILNTMPPTSSSNNGMELDKDH